MCPLYFHTHLLPPPTPPCSSAIAFGKLHAILPSKPLHLPGKNWINIGLLGANLAAGWAFATAPDPSTAVTALGECVKLLGCKIDWRWMWQGSGLSRGAVWEEAAAPATRHAYPNHPTPFAAATSGLAGVLGAHTVASIGGADMPVVITLLNSYRRVGGGSAWTLHGGMALACLSSSPCSTPTGGWVVPASHHERRLVEQPLQHLPCLYELILLLASCAARLCD